MTYRGGTDFYLYHLDTSLAVLAKSIGYVNKDLPHDYSKYYKTFYRTTITIHSHPTQLMARFVSLLVICTEIIENVYSITFFLSLLYKGYQIDSYFEFV